MRWTLLLFNLLFTLSVTAQGLDQEQLLANIRYSLPELVGAELSIGDLESSPYDGLKQGLLLINDQQTIEFLLSEELGHLILLTTSPIDVSLTQAEIDQKIAEQLAQERQVAEESHRALSRFANGRPSRGPSDAPITIYEFSDFQCPYCARASKVVEQLLDKYPELIRFVYLHFPLDMHDWAKPAAIAAECAARQSDAAFWVLHDKFFELQSQISSDSMIRTVRSWLGETSIDLDLWQACAEDESTATNQGVALDVDISTSTAQRFGLTGTPAFYVNGFLLNGSRPIEAFESLIDRIQTE